MTRVVITGMGLITPLGRGINANWKSLISGISGITSINKFNTKDFSCKVGGQVPTNKTHPSFFDVDSFISPKDKKRMDDFILFGLAAADDAIVDSGWKPQNDMQCDRTGVIIGSGIGGLQTIYNNSIVLKEQGPRRISPFFIPSSLINLISGQVSIRHNFRGPNHAVVTACSTGANAIGDAARIIKYGNADVMVAGGAEAALCPLGVAGFSSIKALSTSFNDYPEKASRPWDQSRDGFVMGEGSGVVVLENYEHAKSRNAKIYGEILGYGLSGDAYHITAPAENGDGGFRAMKGAIDDAGLNLLDIDYINAHGTSTPKGDIIELNAVKRLFQKDVNNLSMSSTKSSTGHLLGASGSVEFIFSVLSINNKIAPATLNLENPSEGCDIDLVPISAKDKEISHVLSNSFGFGGTNASLVVGPSP